MFNTKLYIGVETKVREFDSKILLACVAAEAGYEAVLGQQKKFVKQLAEMPLGIWMNKSISPSKAKTYARYRQLGYRLVAYDEEGLAPFNADEYKKRRVSAEALQHLEYFFAWGPWQTDVIAGKTATFRHKIVPVGHPRVDMTRRELRGFYHEDAQRLREQYGRFLLVNTNFSFYNHFQGEGAGLTLLERAGKIADDAQRAYYVQMKEHKKTLFYAFAEMIARLRERFPELAVVVRPHPSENHDFWRQTLPQDPKIQVVHEGTVLPWILAAEVAIHNSCTTGIESFLLEQPVLAYRPVHKEEFDIQLPNLLSDQVLTLDALLEKVEAYCTVGKDGHDAQGGNEEKWQIAARYIASLDGPLACDRTVAQLLHIQPPHTTWRTVPYRCYATLKHVKNTVLKTASQWKSAPQTSREQVMKDYRAQKFPGIELAEVQRAMQKLHALTGRFGHLQAAQLDKNLFRIIRLEHG